MENVNLDNRLEFPANLNNRVYIADVLRNVLPYKGVLLEITIGSVEHDVFFSKVLPFNYLAN